MQEWMLMGVKPVYNSGFEKDEFDAYATDSFQEILDTSPIVDTVYIYSSDLVDEKEIQCIIQDALTDSQTKEDQRSMLASIGTCSSSSYVKYDNLFWLILNTPGNNKIYEKVLLHSCDWNLKWQNSSGKIIERWCITSRQYSTGIDENKVLQLGANQKKILIPYDTETIKIIRGKRFYIDNNLDKPTPYEVESINSTEYVKNGHGYLEIIVKETTQTTQQDRPDLMLCDYFEPPSPVPPDETTDLLYAASISSFKQTIIYGKNRKFTAVFKDKDGNVVTTLSPKWTITSDFADKLTTTYGTSDITISVANDSSLDGKKFKLKLEADDDSAVETEITITIVALF